MSVLDRHEWSASVTLCLHEDAEWIKVKVAICDNELSQNIVYLQLSLEGQKRRVFGHSVVL